MQHYCPDSQTAHEHPLQSVRAASPFFAPYDSIIYADGGFDHSMAVFRSVPRDPCPGVAYHLSVAKRSTPSSAGDNFRLALAAVRKNGTRAQPDGANAANPDVESAIGYC